MFAPEGFGKRTMPGGKKKYGKVSSAPGRKNK
jgi:hypothetical protein